MNYELFDGFKEGFFDKLDDNDFYEILRAMRLIKGYFKEKNTHYFYENMKKSLKKLVLTEKFMIL